MSQLLRTAAQLDSYLQLHKLSLQKVGLDWLTTISQPFPLRVSTYYAQLIDWKDPTDPLKLICLPDSRESTISAYELADPIGDEVKEAVPGLIHRYPDRVLLLLTMHCRMHCRFCFRREVVGQVRQVAIPAIASYLHKHSEVREVIFSGGDPFTIPAAFLRSIQEKIAGAKNIKTWRFHTRIPAIDPDAITPELFAFLSELVLLKKRVVVVVHVDHVREVTAEFAQVVSRLQQMGVAVLSQTVLLKGVNASVADLTKLFRSLWESGVKPYYLHHLDTAKGTSHFRISIAQGKKIYQQLRGNLSTLCVPEYVLDLPGGFGKTPINTLTQIDDATYQAVTFENKIIKYTDYGAEL